MTNEIYSKIEHWTGEKIVKRTAIGGGCISNTEKLEMNSGKLYFLKCGSSGKMFRCEAHGLIELAKAEVIRVPKVLLTDEKFILMEYVIQGSKKENFYRKFGQQLAVLHQFNGEKFGLFENNYIGSTPQLNIAQGEESVSWAKFFMNQRLLFQYRLAEQNGYATEKLRKGFHLLENKIESILAGTDEKPSLLHGDLWSGNYLCDESGNPVLIDPAVYYGHREADLAMTKLFGGFSPEFYSAYREEFPLKEGADYRENLYMLYHIMNHLNLFGKSYYAQAERTLWQYL